VCGSTCWVWHGARSGMHHAQSRATLKTDKCRKARWSAQDMEHFALSSKGIPLLNVDDERWVSKAREVQRGSVFHVGLASGLRCGRAVSARSRFRAVFGFFVNRRDSGGKVDLCTVLNIWC
jgi:hypothetical protein